MELNELLGVMDRAAANLAKLEDVWHRAAPFIPEGPARGSHPEYDDLARAWDDLLAGLPPVDGWTIGGSLPDIDELGQSFIELFEIGEPDFDLRESAAQPARDIAEYRFRLHRARRRAAQGRLEQLIIQINVGLPRLLEGVPRDSGDRLSGADLDQIRDAVAEIERLVGAAQRRGPWGALYRHMHFGQGHDWHDIHEFDWPGVRSDVQAAAFSDTDPLPVPDIDLGRAASGRLTGTATVALPWELLDDDGFERLLYDLLRDFPEHQNVQWLMQTRASDRGRDLSLERVLHDSTGSVRTERVIVQAKHWRKKSVAVPDLANTLASIKAWQPPVVRVLVLATSGRFSADAVDWAEQHNLGGDAPLIELWPDSKLETLLAQKPHLAAAHGLR